MTKLINKRKRKTVNFLIVKHKLDVDMGQIVISSI